MKIKVALIIIFFVLIAGSAIKYLDLLVSEKYETQLEGLNPTKEQIQVAEVIENKIDINKKICFGIVILSILGIGVVSYNKRVSVQK